MTSSILDVPGNLPKSDPPCLDGHLQPIRLLIVAD
jgi:hypothetical protein